MDDDQRVENVFDLLRDAVNFICRIAWNGEMGANVLLRS